VAGNIVIKESDKSGTAATNVFRPTLNSTKGIRVSLHVINPDNSTAIADEAFASYSPYFSNNVDEMDPVKLPNINENLGISRNGQSLMIERRKEGEGYDTTYLKLWNTIARDYVLQVNPVNLSGSSVISALLEDRYLKTSTVLSLTDITKINFIIDQNPASADPDRFKMIVLFRKSVLPPGFTNGTFKVSPNPINGKSVNIQFIDQPAGDYYVEFVNTLGQIVLSTKLKHGGGSANQSLQLMKNRVVKGEVYRMRIRNNQSKTIFATPVLSN
jgi:hypothetical protein